MKALPHTPLAPRNTTLASLRSIGALVLREMGTTYGRSAGGYLWAILEPAAGILLLSLVFSIGFRSPPLGSSFALFYATGLLPFLLYTDLSAKLSQTIQFNRALLNYPRVTFVDALLARFLLNLLAQMIVQIMVMGLILIWLRGDVAIQIQPLLFAYLAALWLALGIGTLNSFLTVAFPVWQSIWSILNRPLFLVSGIFFLFEAVPQPYRDLLWYNPLIHIVGATREGFYGFYHPTYVTLVYPFAVGATALTAGLFLLNRFHRDILSD